MPLRNLNHINVRARDLKATRDFYVKVLGLREGDRPPFNFSGHWIYLGDQAVIHLVAADDRAARAHTGESAAGADGGAIDHVAFEATGLREMIARLEARGIEALHRKVPSLGLHQVFVHDPNGVKIELNYPAAEGEVVAASP